MLRKISDTEVKSHDPIDVDPDQELSNEERLAAASKAFEAGGKYEPVWKAFGKSIKMGVIEDKSNR